MLLGQEKKRLELAMRSQFWTELPLAACIQLHNLLSFLRLKVGLCRWTSQGAGGDTSGRVACYRLLALGLSVPSLVGLRSCKSLTSCGSVLVRVDLIQVMYIRSTTLSGEGFLMRGSSNLANM